MDPKYWWDILRHQQTSAVIRHVFDEKIIGSVSSAKQFITALVKRRAVINQLLYKYIHNYIYTDAGENNLRQTNRHTVYNVTYNPIISCRGNVRAPFEHSQ